MRTAKREDNRVNTGSLRERAGGETGPCKEFSDAVKKRAKTVESSANRKAGTGFAILSLPIGYAPAAQSAPLFKHGGARNSASRTSDYVSPNKAARLIGAAQSALTIGRPLNRHIVAHWEAAGITDAEAMAAITQFLKYLREWLGGETAYIWVRENGDGKGSHVHILAHIPEGKRMSGALSRRWVERCTNRPYRAGTIFTRKIAGAGQPEGPPYAENLAATLAYVLKGTEPDAAEAMGIRHEYGGRVIAKRCGVSRNIT